MVLIVCVMDVCSFWFICSKDGLKIVTDNVFVKII